MSKETVRRRIKLLAKVIAGRAFLPVLLVILLQMATGMLFSALAGELSARMVPNAVWRVFGFSFWYMDFLLSVAFGLLLLPLTLGVSEFLQRLVREQKPRVSGIFLWFSDRKKLSAVLSYALFTVLFSAAMLPLTELPMQYVWHMLQETMADLQTQVQNGATMLQVNTALFDWPRLLAAGLLPLLGLLVNARLVALPYLLVDRPQDGAFAAAGASWRMMRGHTWEYVLLLLSFLGWYIAAMFTFLVAGLYFLPYLRLSIVIFVAYVQSGPLLQPQMPGAGERV